MPNYGYHLARSEARLVRRCYAGMLSRLVRRAPRVMRDLPFEVFSYSGEAALPEQVASIRSFLQQAGRPSRFTVMSDGTYTARSRALLESVDRCVAVQRAADCVPQDLPPSFQGYLREHPTGRQLAVIMSLPRSGPAFYIDSDVLFFAGAGGLVDHLTTNSYQLDCQQSGDARLLRDGEQVAPPANTGVLYLDRPLDWSIAIQRFLDLEGAPAFFTNQTLTHLALHANGAQPLDPRKFVLELDDQFVFADRYAGPDLILRHYVNPVRHKFWNALLRHG